MPCECADSSSADKDHNHTVTGNLTTVTNNKLRNASPKYQENRSPDLEKFK